MTVESNIKNIDIQGEVKKVLTDYQPHTISIVGEGALGINLTRLKSRKAFLETEGGANLMAKVEKAKALDELNKEEQEVVENTDPVVKPEAPVEDEEGTDVDTEVVEQDKTVEPSEDVTEDTEEELTPEPEPVQEDEAPAPEAEAEAEDVLDIDVDVESIPTEKAKSFTTSEMIQAQKDALDGVNALVQKISTALPDADIWKISELVRDALYAVEDAKWSAENSLWDDIYTEVYEEVNTRVNKAKALKVMSEGTQEEKLKSALSLLSPEMAAIVQEEISTNKAKALEAETQRKETIRAKALEQGSEIYKRIATDDNTTDMIVDSMIAIEQDAPEHHKVIAKALETASRITMAGNLFPDVGSASALQVQTEEDYVESKAKSLVDEKGGNLAAARATIRGTMEYQTMYGK